MDAKDRAFADMAVRLQLLTREQVSSCAAKLAHSPSKHMPELALELGLLSNDEIALIRTQESRLAERRTGARGAGAVEELGPKVDPRSASAPKTRAVEPTIPLSKPAKRASPRSWDAPAEPEQGQVYIPRTTGAAPHRCSTMPIPVVSTSPRAPSSPVGLADTLPDPESEDDIPTETRPRPSREMSFADTAPVTPTEGTPRPHGTMLTAAGAVAKKPKNPTGDPIRAPRGHSVDVFPMADGAVETVDEPYSVAPTRDSVSGKDPRSATLINPQNAQLEATSQAMGATLLQAYRPALKSTESTSPTPPKATKERPTSAALPAETYLGKALVLAMQKRASDLHLHSGAPLMVRVDGRIVPLSGAKLVDAEATENAIAEVLTDVQWAALTQRGEVDFAYTLPGSLRARVNVYRQQRGMDAVFHILAEKIVPMEKLGIPEVVHALADLESGLVLIAGPRDGGKSSTLAALVDLINRRHARHIVTIEHPVELVHSNKNSIISQREIGIDSDSYAVALKAALRQDADVILIGDMPDAETTMLAVDAASKGVLVLAALHGTGSAKTIDRVVSAFPMNQQQQARAALAESLAAVVSQILVPRKSGGRVAAHEILLRTPSLSNAIREGHHAAINTVLNGGKALGMQSMDSALLALVDAGVISGRDALRNANDKKAFSALAES